ncbi:unnamed protein product [Clavelina lepadiformis]|uniref:Ribitol-5-phosphate transferase FKTN N-terminal domain-containing protein n=1 Tax=Clavelina lepadiformis TaxID=159417 RepID=A0ABP0FAH7_CLALP
MFISILFCCLRVIKMKDLTKQVFSIKVKTLIAVACGVWFLSVLYTYAFADTYTFHKLSKRSIDIQKECLGQFFEIFRKNRVPLILFDVDILPELFQARPRSWHKSDHECKTLCKYHPENKNVITFAIQSTKFDNKKRDVIHDLKEVGFVVHITRAVDPRPLVHGDVYTTVPTYLWLAKNDHVIHVAILYERIQSYVWVGPVTDSDWKETVDTLAPTLSDGWHSMDIIGAKFPMYAQAMDKSQRFLGLPLEIDGHKLNVPYHIRAFLEEYKNSHFIECDHERARQYKLEHRTELTQEESKFKEDARKVLLQAKEVLDQLEVPFFLSGATCLGWYRQCDIIPYSKAVVFGINAKHYNMKIMEGLHDAGLTMTHKYGKIGDSLQMFFIGPEKIKLELSFFYDDYGNVWHGGTQEHDRRKYKFSYSWFKLCWTEFLEIKIRVPCEPAKYIETKYGKDWMYPIKKWQWNLHPYNVETNGKWSDADREVAIQVFEPTDEHRKRVDDIREVHRRIHQRPTEEEIRLSEMRGSMYNENYKKIIEPLMAQNADSQQNEGED